LKKYAVIFFVNYISCLIGLFRLHKSLRQDKMQIHHLVCLVLQKHWIQKNIHLSRVQSGRISWWDSWKRNQFLKISLIQTSLRRAQCSMIITIKKECVFKIANCELKKEIKVFFNFLFLKYFLLYLYSYNYFISWEFFSII